MSFLAATLLTLASPALAAQPALPKTSKSETPTKVLPLKGASSANSCTAYGPGFVKLAGTDTCVHVGGSVSVGGGIGGR